METAWKQHPAQHFHRERESDRLVCSLCPRNCSLRENQAGFCRVRKNDAGNAVSLNYGVSVRPSQEIIETEAVYHYQPGAPILSLGNVGCMLNCDFCHNWQTSQVRHLNHSDTVHITPDGVISTALEKKLPILSWTYNDPVVWHEFVTDTARLAKQSGLQNLYKSAFYISPKPVEELLECIDVFSISLKSMDDDFYRRVTKGRLAPVLDATKLVYQSKRHLEISHLLIPGLNDELSQIRKLVDWILTELDENIPLHLVRFHPDYKYTHVDRTPLPLLYEARDLARKMGIRHCYLGNVYEEHAGQNTYCQECQELQIHRFGLRIDAVGLGKNGRCLNCQTTAPISGGLDYLFPSSSSGASPQLAPNHDSAAQSFHWKNDINACHVELHNQSSEPAQVHCQRIGTTDVDVYDLRPDERWRFIVSRSHAAETGFQLGHCPEVSVALFQVLDRAHFPVPSTGEVS